MKSFKQFIKEDVSARNLSKEDIDIILKELKLPEKYVRNIEYIGTFKDSGSIIINLNAKFFEEVLFTVSYYDKSEKALKCSDKSGLQLTFRKEKSNNKFVIDSYISQLNSLVKDLSLADLAFNDLCEILEKNPENAEKIVNDYKKLKGKQFQVIYNNGLLKIIVLPIKPMNQRDRLLTPCFVYDIKTNKRMIGTNSNSSVFYDYREYNRMMADFLAISNINLESKLK